MRLSITALADFVKRRRWFLLVAWLAILAASVYGAPKFMDVTSGGGFNLPDSESWHAADVLQDEFGQGYGRTVQLLFDHPSLTVTDPAYREEVESLVQKIMYLPGAAQKVTYYDTGLDSLVSPDGRATYALVTFAGAEEDIQKQIPDIRRIAAGSPGFEVHVIGGPAFDHDLEETSESDLRKAETYGLPLVILILILVFGSLVAAGLPVLLGGVSVATTLAILYVLGHWLDMSVFVLNTVTMIGLGLGTDYSLFIVSRYREELSEKSPQQAMEATLATAGRAVVFSGAAVAIGMAMLMLFNIVFMRSFGISGVLVAVISVLAAITLLPVILVMLKRGINYARVVPARYLRGGGGRFWRNWSRAVMKRPVIFFLVSMGILVALAVPLKDMKAGSPGTDDLAPESDSRIGIEKLAQRWSPGEVSPVYIVFETGSIYGAFSSDFNQVLAELVAEIKKDPRVERVDSIAEFEFPGDPRQLELFARENPEIAAKLASLVNIEEGAGKTIVRILPVEPGGSETRALVKELRSDTIPGTSGLSGVKAYVGGSAAEVVDFTEMLTGAFPFLLAAVLVITYFVLLFLFRSLILPFKAIFMNLLSVAAAYGVLVIVFQKGWGESIFGITAPGGILPFVPVILFAILFGLSMDYEVFLLSRMKEEYDQSRDNEKAVAVGLAKTGRIITTAALIMIVVFGSFAFTQSLVIKEFGVGLSVSILLDATIVRIVLVPATMKLLGKWNWWIPRWLEKILPDFSFKH